MNTSKRYAVVVGVADYQDDQIGQLKYTKDDALRMAELLIQHGEFDRHRVYLLANGMAKEDKPIVVPMSPTRGDLLQKVKYVAESAGNGDLVYFFFAGHGAEVSKTPYLLTTDTKMDVLQHTAVRVTDLNEMFEQSRATCLIKVFDACRSPFGETRGALGRMTTGLQEAMLKIGKGWASFSSCSSGEVAHESGEFGHGVFTYYLCEGIAGKAANEQGHVTLERLVDYVKTSVGNWSDEQSQKQTPHFQSDLSGTVALSTVRRPVTPPPPDLAGPLEVLRFGIDKHLLETPQDARNLTFTDEKEWAAALQLADRSVRLLVEEFSHASLTISVSENIPIDKFGDQPIQEFNKDINQKKVSSEYKSRMNAVQVHFRSSEVVLPATVLTIGVAQFSFFYWLWYCHECSQTQLKGSFNPEPRLKKGVFTFKPRAALDGRKVENAVKEIVKRAGEDIISWAEQLRKYVDGRLLPLRAIEKVVE